MVLFSECKRTDSADYLVCPDNETSNSDVQMSCSPSFGEASDNQSDCVSSFDPEGSRGSEEVPQGLSTVLDGQSRPLDSGEDSLQGDCRVLEESS